MRNYTEEGVAEESAPDRSRQGRTGLPPAVLDAIPAGIALLDADGLILGSNAAWRRLAGGEVGESYPAAHEGRDGDGPGIAAGVRDVLAGRSRLFEAELPHPGQEPRWLRLTAAPADGPAGARAVVMHLDITQRKRTGEALGRQEAARRVRAEFLATLSHELRTPLTPVLFGIEALRADPRLPVELTAELERMRRNIQLEAGLIDDLLDLTHLARGRIELEPQVLDLHEVLRDTVATSGHQVGQALPAIALDLAAGESWVCGDRSRLGQVFWNILHNAVKFTPSAGAITVRTANVPPGSLRVEVIDTGSGIASDLLPHVFDPFEQGDELAARRRGGLGLGLTIAHTVIELHGGTLAAASAGAGRGAVFTVTLPLAPRPAARKEAREKGGARREAGLRLLLVEDHEDTALALAELLRAAGHQVTLARSLAEARAAAAAERFDLLLSDLGLPDGSGHDLMRELAGRHGLKGIALSGYGMEEDLARSRESGFLEHLTKPVDLQKLKDAIGQVAAAPPAS